MSPFINRQTFQQSISPKFPLLSPPFNKVLDTICINCNLTPTPTSKEEYKHLLKIISKSDLDIEDMNVAYILRSQSDLYLKESKLLDFMELELGFLIAERVFKNSATYL